MEREPNAIGTESICSIILGDWATRLEIRRDGTIVDQAVMGLGGLSLQINDDNEIVAISEQGETFLDAIAKKFRVGDRVDPEMLELLANLMAEAVVNAVVRKRPPQISMRLLDSEPLTAFYDVRSFFVGVQCAPTRLGTLFGKGVQASLDERGLAWRALQ